MRVLMKDGGLYVRRLGSWKLGIWVSVGKDIVRERENNV